MKLRKLIAVATVVSALAACGDDKEPSDTTGPPTTEKSSQLANPASEYCVAQGGTIELVDEADGQVGYCNLPDGSRIEEWELYNSNGD